MKTRVTVVVAFTAVVTALLTSAACGRLRPTPIREILRNPAAFEGQTVRISGTVVDATNLLVVKYYHLEDSTGRITVVARKAVPLRGSQVTVAGKVHQAFVIGDESLTVIVEEP